MGFSIVCKRQGAMDILTSTEARETRHKEKVTARELLHVTGQLAR